MFDVLVKFIAEMPPSFWTEKMFFDGIVRDSIPAPKLRSGHIKYTPPQIVRNALIMTLPGGLIPKRKTLKFTKLLLEDLKPTVFLNAFALFKALDDTGKVPMQVGVKFPDHEILKFQFALSNRTYTPIIGAANNFIAMGLHVRRVHIDAKD